MLCILFNIVNVWMEEGVFRGLFLKTLSETKPFMQANFIAAFLFGIWHIVMPIRSYVNGEMSFAAMLLMAIGYIILAGIMGIKYVVSLKGADELQIVRIMAAQIISFAFVMVVYYCRKRNANR
ncbi:CPBP family intramembrane glutamic endopeptidase [Parablautia intestinalis]|uniref:CPBP family intramembrane glutamic endopeptidase n=1 Tax=Parablautia intestinalis TaxID=2320100 RepID=UPI00256EE435|nr:CPBP family intramembrane glutamic endopeptidase [Parablautia intestinalis]